MADDPAILEPDGESESDRNAVERVIRRIKADLLAGRLAPGDKLPGERELAQIIGVSRASLREGLRVLAHLGLIATRHGLGSVIAPPDVTILRDVTTLTLGRMADAIDETMEVRIAIECQAIRLACVRASASDLRIIEARLSDLVETLDDPHAGGKADHAFHTAVVEASHCRPLIGLYEATSDLLSTLHERRREETVAIDGIRNYLVKAHREVYLAVLNQDPEQADRQLREHFRIGEAIRRQGQASRIEAKFASA